MIKVKVQDYFAPVEHDENGRCRGSWNNLHSCHQIVAKGLAFTDSYAKFIHDHAWGFVIFGYCEDCALVQLKLAPTTFMMVTDL